MKKIVFAAVASIAALAAVPAAAQTVTGTVNVTGNVAARCAVQTGNTEVAAFGGTLALGRLDAADGTLRSGLVSATTASPADAQKVSARVVCTTGNPTLTIGATKLSNGAAEPTALGYSNVIDYTASLKVTKSDSSVADVLFNTKTAAVGSTTTTQLGGRIKGGTDNNVEVSIFGLNAKNGATSVLDAGDYTSTVTVTIQPTA
ncbi:MAG: hypothetical protein ABW194_11850 [Novosphingobium sp.]